MTEDGDKFTCTVCGQDYLAFEGVESRELWQSPGPDSAEVRCFGFDDLREHVRAMQPYTTKTYSHLGAGVDGRSTDAVVATELHDVSMLQAMKLRARKAQGERVDIIKGEPVVFDVSLPVEQPEPDAVLCEMCHAIIFEDGLEP